MDISAPLTVGVEVIKRAFFVVVGYFAAKLGISYLSKGFPAMAGFGNAGVLGVGLVGAAFTSGILQELAMGAALLGAVNMVDGLLTPVLAAVPA